MPQQTINIGSAENDGTGDTIRASFDKANQNFTEVYGSLASHTASLASLTTAVGGKEGALGNPAANGYILSSLMDGTRSWVPSPSGGSGDMLKATYDPRGANYISGVTVIDATGGLLNMDAQGTSGGGSVLTYGGGSAGASGGTLSMYGATLPGGNLDLSDGGGSISTRGAGLIGLGAAGTRTSITGSATTDRAQATPDKDGTFAMLSDIGTPFDPHSPGPIGDVTPGTIAVTTSTLGGNVTFSSDGSYDIGASGATRPRNLYLTGTITSDGRLAFANGDITVAPNLGVNWSGSAYIVAPAAGVLKLENWYGGDFNRLQFGGTTSSFPAIKRSGTTLAFRLSDDSADAPITAGEIVSSGQITNSIDYTGAVKCWGSNIGWESKSQMQSPSNGVIVLYNLTGSDFSLLLYGGVTAGFPAHKRSGTTIQARLADDSGFTASQGKLTTDTAATTGLTAGVLSALTTASIAIYDSTGQAYRVPCVI